MEAGIIILFHNLRPVGKNRKDLTTLKCLSKYLNRQLRFSVLAGCQTLHTHIAGYLHKQNKAFFRRWENLIRPSDFRDELFPTHLLRMNIHVLYALPFQSPALVKHIHVK